MRPHQLPTLAVNRNSSVTCPSTNETPIPLFGPLSAGPARIHGPCWGTAPLTGPPLHHRPVHFSCQILKATRLKITTFSQANAPCPGPTILTTRPASPCRGPRHTTPTTGTMPTGGAGTVTPPRLPPHRAPAHIHGITEDTSTTTARPHRPQLRTRPPLTLTLRPVTQKATQTPSSSTPAAILPRAPTRWQNARTSQSTGRKTTSEERSLRTCPRTPRPPFRSHSPRTRCKPAGAASCRSFWTTQAAPRQPCTLPSSLPRSLCCRRWG